MANDLIRHLRRAVLLAEVARLSDGDLLERFVADRNESAVEALVLRHGPMVWGVCRRILRDHQDAEDAFQATFLVLARKADSIRPGGRVAGWLYGVARQTALKARARNRKRQAREQLGVGFAEPEAAPQERQDDLRGLLDQQLARLPEKYRAVLVLCDLEGRTRGEAARQLGCPQGTVAGRLARARSLLARRLARQGLAGASGSLAVLVSPSLLPASGVCQTIETMTAAGVASARVAALTEGVLRTMLLTRLKIAGMVLLAASVLSLATGTVLIPATAAKAGSGEARAAGRDRTEQPPPVQLRIAGPAGMKVHLVSPTDQGGKSTVIDVPGRLDLRPGKRYRLKLTDIPNRPGVRRFPTVEIPKLDGAAETFASVSAIPIPFTDRDFKRVDEGQAITKVVYLAKRKEKENEAEEPITIASYDYTGPGLIEEAKRRGTVLVVVRMGNIDLKTTHSGKPVEIQIGSDSIQGRVVRTGKQQATAKEREDLAKRLAEAVQKLNEMRAALVSAQVRNEVLKKELEATKVRARSLQEELARLREKLKKASAGSGN
jgi:RNA polymerase sigma factor (sigma-70 family)